MKGKTNPITWVQGEIQYEEGLHAEFQRFLRQEADIKDDADLERRLAKVMKDAKPAEHVEARWPKREYVEGATYLKEMLMLPEVRVVLGESGGEISLFDFHYSTYAFHRGEAPDNELTATAHEMIWKDKGKVQRRMSIESPIETWIEAIPYNKKMYERGERLPEHIETEPRMIRWRAYTGMMKVLRKDFQEGKKIVDRLQEEYQKRQ